MNVAHVLMLAMLVVIAVAALVVATVALFRSELLCLTLTDRQFVVGLAFLVAGVAYAPLYFVVSPAWPVIVMQGLATLLVYALAAKDVR